MPTATKEIFRDDQPLFQGTHVGADSSATLEDSGARFKELGVDASLGQYVENTTQSTAGNVTASTSNNVTVSGVTWDNGDTYKIYRTAAKSSYISGNWVDVSRGWRIKKDDDVTSYGWRREDVDLDEPNRRDVFGPGQPE